MTEPVETEDTTEIATPEPPVVYGVHKGMWGSGPGDVSGYGGIARPVVRHRHSQRPYGEWYDKVADRLAELVPGLPDAASTDRGEFTLYVPKDRLKEVVRAARDDAFLRFETCTSVSGIHYPDEPGAEFHVVYTLLSMTHNRRMRLEVATSEADPVIDSVTDVYPHTNWHERETWDMFGIVFTGHPALTRILMPDDWVGHPQRKDYPLGGIPVEFKGAKVPPPDERRSY